MLTVKARFACSKVGDKFDASKAGLNALGERVLMSASRGLILSRAPIGMKGVEGKKREPVGRSRFWDSRPGSDSETPFTNRGDWRRPDACLVESIKVSGDCLTK